MDHTSPICRIFMLCEDNTAFIRAMDLRDSLAVACRNHVAIFGVFSRFDWLHHPKLNEHADTFIKTADLIVLVAEGSRDLPPVAQAWLASLTRQSHARKPALALYLNHMSTDSSARIRARIHQLAATLDVDFFSNLIPDSEPDKIIPDGHDFVLTPQNIARLLHPHPPSHPPLF
jgi:hypothetical protein